MDILGIVKKQGIVTQINKKIGPKIIIYMYILYIQEVMYKYINFFQ